MVSNFKTIYVQLLEEGTVVYRPACAETLSSGYFKIQEQSDFDPEDESWEFKPGAIVECILQRFENEELLVAVREAK